MTLCARESVREKKSAPGKSVVICDEKVMNDQRKLNSLIFSLKSNLKLRSENISWTNIVPKQL